MTQQKWHQTKALVSAKKIQVDNNVNDYNLARLLACKGITSQPDIHYYLNPEDMPIVEPSSEFGDLLTAVDIIVDCIENSKKITICGDYDADGMTSTAVLLRALRHCGAFVDYVIPSRMTDGYGINNRIVDECGRDKTDTIITVDNGISAVDACEYAINWGMRVIITDHHNLPEVLPMAHAILNPKMLDGNSPYQSLAGVGVAYILAISVCSKLGKLRGIVKPLMELFAIGTIADMASLTGINRKWVKRGLQYLAKSDVVGIQAILCCMNEYHKQRTGYPLDGMTPDTIGFKIAPRINAIGRIGNPQTVIELLTTESSAEAYKLAQELEETNERRKVFCEQIEREAIEIVEAQFKRHLSSDRILYLCEEGWHHGVIGIVASRLVERYGVPVFIATRTEDGKTIRGSARGIPGFNVYDALNYCSSHLLKYGGHPMAGGFTLGNTYQEFFWSDLVDFARQSLKPSQIGTQTTIDAIVNLADIDSSFVSKLKQLQPFGVGNSEPIFRANKVYIDQQKKVGEKGIKMTVSDSAVTPCTMHTAISWILGEQYPLPGYCDIVFRVKEKVFREQVSIELEVIGIKEITSKTLSKRTSLITT